MMTQTFARPAMPTPPLQQKEQKNFRLTTTCLKMMQDLALAWGTTESSVIERVIRESHEQYGFTLQDTRKRKT